MQFYESHIPPENGMVAIRITKINEYGVEASLLEYSNAPPAIIYNKELSRKRVRSIKDIVHIGQETAADVIAVTSDSIELSIKQCKQDDIDTILNEYKKHKAIHGILKSIVFDWPNPVDGLNMLYETIIWPIERMNLDVYNTFLDLYKSTEWIIDTPYINQIHQLVVSRFPSPTITKSRNITIRCSNSLYTDNIITNKLHTTLEKFKCDIHIISPPIYRIQVTADSDETANKQLNDIEEFLNTEVDYSYSYIITNVIESPIVLDLADISTRQAIMNIGTLGNVSEGKSTFVRALSKVATQRHKKEKIHNITINLGYAGFKIWRNIETGDLVSSSSSTKNVEGHELLGHYSFVDCPGHEAYLATMLSGAAVMDAAVLLIASNSSNIPQIQTQEHLIAAEIMGLSHIFVLHNKLDVVDPATAASSFEKIQTFIKGTSAEYNPIIPISAQREWGLEYALHHIAYNIPQSNRIFEGGVRMQLVRSFDVNRPFKWSPDSKITGGVIGGTLQRGVIFPNDLLEIRPGLFIDGQAIPIITRVTSLNCDAEQLPMAIAGGLIGVGTTMDPSYTVANALVGHVAGTPGTLPDITVKIKGKFRAFNRSQYDTSEDTIGLSYRFKKHKEGDEIRLCVGSMTVRGKISKVGDKGQRIIKLERPICVDIGQICSILRSNGSRELLDGIIIIESVKPFKNICKWDTTIDNSISEFREVVMKRRYTVISNNLITNSVPLPTYNCMLDAVIDTVTEVNTIKLPSPSIQRLPKKTAWLNMAETIAAIEKYSFKHDDSICLATHFQSYLMSELSTTLTVKKDGQYVLAGRFTENNCCIFLKKYIQQYHKCKQCNSYNTCLIRQNRILMLICGDCTSSYTVDI